MRDKTRNSVRQVTRWGLGHVMPRTVMRVAGRRGDLQGQLVSVPRGGDPFPVLERIRAQGPLYRSKFAYVTTSLPVVREVLSSNDFRTGFEPGDLSGPIGRAFAWAAESDALGPLVPPSLLVTEPPDHTRYRKLVTRVFSVRAVENLRSRTEQIAAELLDGLAGSDPGRPRRGVLHVAARDRDRRDPRRPGQRARARPRLRRGSRPEPRSRPDVATVPHGRGRPVASSTRGSAATSTPCANVPATTCSASSSPLRDDGVGLDERELKATAGLVLAAGFETTVNLLGNGIALFDKHRDQLELLRSQPELWPNAVDEILRLDPPVLLTGRTARRDTTVSGTPIRQGTLVTTVLAAANRDPEVFSDPTRFDVTRANAKDHVSFSAGRHFCLGAALARMEGEVGLRMLFERYPDLRTLPGAQRRTTRILRGYAQLPVRLGKRAVVAPA